MCLQSNYRNILTHEAIQEICENLHLLKITSDVRYQIFYILPITIITYLFYHDTIIIMIYVPPLAY